MIKSDKLDYDQNKFINEESKRSGNIWIKGFAGSGKSVLLVHTLKDLLDKKPNAKVLIVVYTLSLVDLFKTGLKELGITTQVPIITYYDYFDHYYNQNSKFDCIFCDEVQDLPSKVLSALYAGSHKVIVAGDSNQSIFETDPKWFEPVIDPEKIGGLIDARPFELNTIYRLSKSIISALSKLIIGMDIWKAKKDETKQDVQIRIYEASSTSEEAKFIWEEAQKAPNIRNESAVILLPTHNEIVELSNDILLSAGKPTWVFKPKSWDVNKPRDKQRPDYYDLNQHFKKNGLKVQYVGNDFGSLEDATKEKNVIIMTYHSAKGLDFDNVFLPYVNGALGGKMRISKTLFMVAMSRSKVNLFLTHVGYTHNYVDQFKDGKNEFGIPITDRKPLSELNKKPTAQNTNKDPFDY